MEEKKKEIKKPPVWLTVQLFLFMMLVIVDICGLIDNFKSSWLDNLDGISPVYALISGCVDIAVYLYSLLSIYKILEHKPYSLFMLRLSVFYIFVQFTFRFLSANYVVFIQIGINILIVLFGVVFFTYLFRSKQIKGYIPKTERRVGLYGAIGLLLYSLCFSL